MKNPKLDAIKTALAQTISMMSGYCGVADADDKAILNFGNGDEDFQITIEDKAPVPTNEPANPVHP